MSQKPLKTTLAALAIALVSSLACDRAGEDARPETKADQAQPASDPAKAAAPAVDPLRDPQLISNKLSPYTACINATRPLVSSHYRRYGEWVDGDGALKRKVKAPAPNDLPAPALEACAKALREGKHLTPPLPEVESAATEYDTRTREYEALALKANAALKAKDATAVKDTHEQLVAAYDRWDNANLALTEKLDGLQEQADADALARVEARAGKGLEYHARELVISGRRFAHCLASVDGNGCSDALTGVERANAAFREKAEAGAEGVKGLEGFGAAAEAFAKAAKTATEALAKDPESQESIASALGTYNALVRASAGLDFPAQAKAP